MQMKEAINFIRLFRSISGCILKNNLKEDTNDLLSSPGLQLARSSGYKSISGWISEESRWLISLYAFNHFHITWHCTDSDLNSSTSINNSNRQERNATTSTVWTDWPKLWLESNLTVSAAMQVAHHVLRLIKPMPTPRRKKDWSTSRGLREGN